LAKVIHRGEKTVFKEMKGLIFAAACILAVLFRNFVGTSFFDTTSLHLLVYLSEEVHYFEPEFLSFYKG